MKDDGENQGKIRKQQTGHRICSILAYYSYCTHRDGTGARLMKDKKWGCSVCHDRKFCPKDCINSPMWDPPKEEAKD